ncbi:efflux RND transporter periplasmic adaptor subunit [Flavobacterium sp. J49]|uniref:efflux RND transporter periplasmic adaptor subunit n=1 Tax=Flavobacterium sp. J49 TaxID=2718534 RepID=UPI0015941DC3|nr:efflux RND transporter periplasmic adaptor subunit [Flavobacterium sp. J49]MBF6642543.1 efflux RND transporter periplasmic adaptor subunit [Flavobacterium sp. J49]NIC03789.1 efflux RND transporter periplasmic adaptor subunit [Flavobacterium sp. J49]
MKIKNIVIAILVIALGGMIAYRITKNKAENEKGNDKNGKKPPIGVSAIVVVPQEFSNTISLSGSIEANEQIEIRSEVSGIVETISFTEGSDVSKGQVLFKVNDIELRAQLAQAKTRESLASENERRAKLLLQKEAISQEEYDIASADFRTAKAQTQLIQAQIGKTTVRAPFSGKIGLRSISPGTYVTPTTLIAKLVSTNPLKITFSIPEKYATEINKNSPITFTVPNVADQFTAKIYALEPAIEATTRTLQIRALTDNSNGKLLPGTFANIELPLKNIKDAIIIPTEAIIPIQDGKKVFIANNGKAKEVKIETLTRTDKDVIVTSGLKIGDTVLTSGVMSLKDEAEIKVKLK